jgi:hypothetical protein
MLIAMKCVLAKFAFRKAFQKLIIRAGKESRKIPISLS